MEELKPGDKLQCQVCGLIVEVVEGAIPTAPTTCCGIEMTKME